MEDLLDFQRSQTVGGRLAAPTVARTATSLAVSRAAVCNFMTA
jgi:hypothetical protein